MKHKRFFELPKWLKLTVLLNIALTAISFLVFFFLEQKNSARWSAITVGVGCGAFITLFQLIVYADDIRLKARLERLHIVDMIERRGNNLEQIAALINSSNRRIFIIAGNAYPILEQATDAPVGTHAPTILEAAIKRGVEVRILIADNNNQNIQAKNKYSLARARLDDLKTFAENQTATEKVPGDFLFHEYSHPPNFYLLVADENVVAGVTFPKCRCPDEPAIHFRSLSPIALSHIRHFVDEWLSVGGTIGQLSVSKNEHRVS